MLSKVTAEAAAAAKAAALAILMTIPAATLMTERSKIRIQLDFTIAGIKGPTNFIFCKWIYVSLHMKKLKT